MRFHRPEESRMMSVQQDWDIKARSNQCHRTEQVFEDGQVIYSRLLFTEEGYVREDFTEAAWELLEDKMALSTWKGNYQAPPPPEEEAVKKETAESMLRKLMEDEDPDKLHIMYILGVMLERKRILVERDVQWRDDGEKIRIYEHKKTGESFLIRDPELKLSELGSIQEEVVIMLGGKPRNQSQEAAQREDFDDEDEEDDDDDD